ncbi:MAG: hypothetical protein WAM24_20025 [Ignavibacteriaceae bacterium]
MSLKTLDDIYFTAKEFYNKKSPEEIPGIKARKIKLEEFYVEDSTSTYQSIRYYRIDCASKF